MSFFLTFFFFFCFWLLGNVHAVLDVGPFNLSMLAGQVPNLAGLGLARVTIGLLPSLVRVEVRQRLVAVAIIGHWLVVYVIAF